MKRIMTLGVAGLLASTGAAAAQEYVLDTGSGTATGISLADALPAGTSFVTGSLRSGPSCAGATSVEDDNASGADESDPFGASVAGTTIAATTATLLPAAAMAIAFEVAID